MFKTLSECGKKFALVMLLNVVFVSVCLAEDLIKALENEHENVWVNPKTLNFNDYKFKIWQVINFKKIEFKNVRSILYQVEYDCKNEESRIIYQIFKDGKFGNGYPVDTQLMPNISEPVAPATVAQLILKSFCPKH